MPEGAPGAAPSNQPTPARIVFHAGELRRVALAFSAFFLILCSYTILRPVRDTMAVQFGAGKLQWLFSATLVFTLLVVPVFGWIVRTVPRNHVLPLVYGFLVSNLSGFYFAFGNGASIATAATFFVWLSVFNLFVVSLFWSRLGDCFSTAESHRLYGYIAAGGTVGALAGPAITALLATRIGTAQLLALSMLLLAAAAACMMALPHRQGAAGVAAPPVGGSILAGIPLTMKLGTLRNIALLVLCYSTVSTVLYVELVALVGDAFQTQDERTRFFASVDLAVNSLALTLQVLGTRKVVHRYGMRATLSTVPLLLIAGLGMLGAWRSMIGFALVQTLHRAGEYALNKPGREMIYTTVDPESRYKAKNFIDTAIYRTGDAASAWLIAAVRAAGFDVVLAVGLPAAALWLLAGFRLGGRHDRHEAA
ncbi:MAG: NTP/NDP exchange transporter [Noviherbaspirillum sp.]